MNDVPYYVPRTSVVSSFCSTSTPFLTNVLTKKITPALCEDNLTIEAAYKASKDSQIIVAVSNPDFKIKMYVHNAVDDSVIFVRDLQGHNGMINEICWTSNECALASASSDGYIAVWDLRTGESVMQLSPTKAYGPMYCLDVKNGLLVAGGEKGIYLWDMNTQKLVSHCPDLHTDEVTQIKFHPTHSNLIFSGGEDTFINVIDLNTGDISDLSELLDNTLPTDQTIFRMGFFGDNYQYLYALSPVSTITLWDIEQCELLAQFNNLRGDINTALLTKLKFPEDKFNLQMDNSSIIFSPVPSHTLKSDDSMNNDDIDENLEFAEVPLEPDVACEEVLETIDHNMQVKTFNYRTSQGYKNKLNQEYVDQSALNITMNTDITTSCSLILHPSAWRIASVVSCHYHRETNSLRVIASTAYGGVVLSTISPQGITPNIIIPPAVLHKEIVRDCVWETTNGPLITVAQDAKLTLSVTTEKEAFLQQTESKKKTATKKINSTPYNTSGRPQPSASKNKRVKL